MSMGPNWTRLKTPWQYLSVEEGSLTRVDGSGEHGSELDQAGDPQHQEYTIQAAPRLTSDYLIIRKYELRKQEIEREGDGERKK